MAQLALKSDSRQMAGVGTTHHFWCPTHQSTLLLYFSFHDIPLCTSPSLVLSSFQPLGQGGEESLGCWVPSGMRSCTIPPTCNQHLIQGFQQPSQLLTGTSVFSPKKWCHLVSAPSKPCDSAVTPGWNSTELFIMGCTLHLNFTTSEALLACLLLHSPRGIHRSNSSTVKANKSWYLSLASKGEHLVLCCAQVRALLPTLGFQQHHSPTPS